MSRLILYHTAGCHLCEEAEALVMKCFAARHIAPTCLKRADIADDAKLLELYATVIPVLRVEDCGLELNWPFGLEDIEGILEHVATTCFL